MCYLKEPPLTQICSLGCYEVSESVWVGVGEVCDIWALKRVCARCFDLKQPPQTRVCSADSP